MTKNKAYIERVSIDEYNELFPDRLELSQLEESEPFDLMLRPQENSPDAYKLIIQIEKLRRNLAGAAFETIFLDADLQPLRNNARPNSRMDEYNMWSHPGMYLRKPGGMIAIAEGFLLSHKPDEHDRFLQEIVAESKIKGHPAYAALQRIP